MPNRVKKCQKLSIVDTFGNFLATYTNFVYRSDSVRQIMFLFVAVIHFGQLFGNKLNFCLSEWLSARSNIDKKNALIIVFHMIWVSRKYICFFYLSSFRLVQKVGLCQDLLVFVTMSKDMLNQGSFCQVSSGNFWHF